MNPADFLFQFILVLAFATGLLAAYETVRRVLDWLVRHDIRRQPRRIKERRFPASWRN